VDKIGESFSMGGVSVPGMSWTCRGKFSSLLSADYSPIQDLECLYELQDAMAKGSHKVPVLQQEGEDQALEGREKGGGN
jgi:hypothetical protein